MNLNLNDKLSWVLGALVILLVCKTTPVNATEISPLFGVGQENFSFDVAGVLPSDRSIKFEPNMAGVTRLGVNAYGFGIGLGFRGSSQNLDSQKGSTDFFDLQLGYHQRNWGVDSFYQTYKGFYTSNTNAIQIFPDLVFKHYGLMGRFALSDSEFSVGGLTDQSEEISTTAGKYFAVGGFRYHDMETSGSLLQQENAGVNVEAENLRRVRVTSFNFGLGAGKYWVSSSRFFIGGLIDVLGTLGIYDYDLADGSSNHSSYLTPSYDLKVGLGYAGEFFKTGVSFIADQTTLKTPGASFIRPSANRILIYLRWVF